MDTKNNEPDQADLESPVVITFKGYVADSFPQSLGIPKKRATDLIDELNRIGKEVYSEVNTLELQSGDLAELIKRASKVVNSPEELAWIAFRLGTLSTPGNPLKNTPSRANIN